MIKEKLKVVDLFCGVGGLSYGFSKDPDFKIVASNEILPNMAKAYQLNHPDVKVYCKDISDFGFSNLKNDLNIKDGEIDLIVGGPPCQAYSTVGKRLIDDPRAKLFQQYYRILNEIKPKSFVFENVKGLLSIQDGTLLNTILSLFESLGYNVKYKLLNSADYGVPQLRERVIIVGTKLDTEFIFPTPTHSDNSHDVNLKSYLTLKDAISDLTVIGNNEVGFEYETDPQNDFQRIMRRNAPDKIMDHNSPKNNEKLIQIMKFLPEGGTPKDLPDHLKPSSGFGNTYSRLWWDRPCTTITRNLGTPSSSRCIHPSSPRPLTTREGARIQCFPDSYIFCGSRGEKNLQIGNAVPTFLSEVIKNSIKNQLTFLK